MSDAVRRFLEERGARADVAAGGLRGLVRQWAQIAAEVARGYQLTLDDYRNDVDVRDLLAGALGVAAPGERDGVTPQLEEADRVFLDATEPGSPVWSDAEPSRWWYRRRPRNAGPALRRDLDRYGG